MTTPVGLELIWALSGGVSDPTNAKYELGWVAEKPTYQNFNWVLQNLDKAKLALAESDVWPWQEKIGYQLGAKVIRNGIIYRCVEAHNSVVNNNPQDPALDSTNSYWVTGAVFSKTSLAYDFLQQEDGVAINEVNDRPATPTCLWYGNELTLNNTYSVIALNTLDSSKKNWVFGNVDGEMVVVDVGNTNYHPDPTIPLKPSPTNTAYRVYHEGYKPAVGDVHNAVEEAPLDGQTYGRKNGQWVPVTGDHIGTAPPPPSTGSGTKWYNLDDGVLYVDIDDGDSSQWVPGNPPNAPNTYQQPAVNQAQLQDITHEINTSDDKRAGYQVYDTTTRQPLWAYDNHDASTWRDASGNIIYTPS
jgi:hypothetical protein